jgi:DNA polymerase-3 subunit delta
MGLPDGPFWGLICLVKLQLESLPTHLQQQLLPAYLISGDDPLLTSEAADAIRAKARASGFTEREVHFFDRGADWDVVRTSVSSMSLFAEKRIVEIRLPTGKPGVTGARVLMAVIGSLDPDTLLLVLTGRLDRDAQNADWVRALESKGGWLAIWPIPTDRLIAWLKARAKRMDLNISDDALELLSDRTEGNLLAARQELEKLKLALPDGKISAEAVLASVADSARFDVSELSESLLEGDTARALRVLNGLKGEGVELPLVLWACIKAVRDLWGAAHGDAGGARSWQRHSAALEKGKRRAHSLPYARLAARAERADRMAKGRLSGDAWDELALLAADLCGRPALPLRGSVVTQAR